jgi:hypothetical protein
MLMLNTRLSRFAQVSDARRSAGDGRSSTTLALWPSAPLCRVTNAPGVAVRRKHTRENVSDSPGCVGTQAPASLAMKSRGSKNT